MSTSADPVIVCDLGALTPAERERRASLAQTLLARAGSVREFADGYALQLTATDALTRESLEWLLLERRCCRFFRLELELAPEGGALEVRLRGGAGVKEFLRAAGLDARSPAASARCC